MKHKIKIGVMGSSQGPLIENDTVVERCREVGRQIAKSNCMLVNGACPGLPNEAARGSKEAGGFNIGISPAFSQIEHEKNFRSPTEYYDLLIFTGMGFMERDIVNIRTSDIVIILGGGIGTLNEFTVAFDEGNVIGILKESGGISNHIPDIVKLCKRDLGDRVVEESDPQKLIEKVLERHEQVEPMIVEDQRALNPQFNPFQYE